MKRVLCAALALLMLTAIAACGGSGSKTAQTSGETGFTPIPVETSTPEPTEVPTPEPTEAPAPEPTGNSGTISSDEFYGTINGSVYENRFLGLGCKLEGYEYMDMSSYATVEDAFKFMDGGEGVSVMIAILGDEQNMTMVNIAVNNLGAAYGSTLSEEQIVSIMMPVAKTQMINGGASNVTVVKETVSFLGHEKPCITATGRLQGSDYTMKLFFSFYGRYISQISVSGLDQHSIDEAIAAFYPLS